MGPELRVSPEGAGRDSPRVAGANSPLGSLARHLAVIENPASGERIRIITTGEETDGRLLVFELQLPPGGRVPAPHLHANQEESFAVLEGRLRIRVRRRVFVIGQGEAATVPQGAAHTFSNPGPGPAVVRVEVRPALRTADLLRAAAGLGARPGPVSLARFLSRFDAEVSAPVLPGLVRRAARILARVAGESTAS